MLKRPEPVSCWRFEKGPQLCSLKELNVLADAEVEGWLQDVPPCVGLGQKGSPEVLKEDECLGAGSASWWRTLGSRGEKKCEG